MSDFVKIKDKENLYRDIKSKALLSTDKTALTNYEKQVKAREAKENEIIDLKERVSKLEEILSKIIGNNN